MKKFNSLSKAGATLGNHPSMSSSAGLKITNNLYLFAGHNSIVRNIGFSGFSVSSVVEEEESRYIENWEDKEVYMDSCDMSSEVSTVSQGGRWEKVLDILELIDKGNVRPDTNIYARLLQSCVNRKALEEGRQVHTQIMNSPFNSKLFLLNSIVNTYAKCGSMEDARQVFDGMCKRDMITWTALISGYVQNQHGEEALKLFPLMLRAGMKPNEFTFSSVLKACASLLTVEHGKQVHSDAIKSGLELHVFVGSALVDMYAKCGNVQDAHTLFHKMPERNVVSWNALIAGYTQNNNGVDALKLYWQMQGIGMKPSAFTFSSILSACASLAFMEQGKLVHAHILKTGCKLDVFVGNALVDMYGKCGCIEDARQVFDRLPRRDVVSWNAMITVCAQHGHGKEAVRLFGNMQLAGIKPNRITILCVLSACSHAGLVNEGRFYFHSMNSKHGITPTADHYACIVDILGRAGHINEAADLINKMPIEPTASIWGALLGACRVHGNMDVGKHAAERLFELEPHDAGPRVLLSNIYAAAGRWDDVAKVRKMMKESGVKKQPGCSWVEVENTVHTFVVNDRSHPLTEKIYTILKDLNGKIKEAGYVVEANFAVLAVEREDTVSYHSEKIALAFALISTPSGAVIRIKKNLRVCGDCHSTIKFISIIAGREIVVRDTNRFHHFKEGVCSCGDYW